VTVTAQDTDTNQVTDSFDVTVNAPAQQQQTLNNPPTVARAIADIRGLTVGTSRDTSLLGVFNDTDADPLTITARSSDNNVAAVSVSTDYSNLTVTAQSRGTTTITVTATDTNSDTVETAFTVKVNTPPTVARAIADIRDLKVGTSRNVFVSGVFNDTDGDTLTIRASSSNHARVTVAVAPNDSKLILSGVVAGTATITVTAQDPDGSTASDTFKVVVIPAPKPPTTTTTTTRTPKPTTNTPTESEDDGDDENDQDASALPTGLDEYDTNNNNQIDLKELLQAAQDYQNNKINQQQILAIIRHYLNN
ncbi:MAG: Ig-like domain-containing protein, partial [Acidimicrobiia bacterium]|nr:Ig-like domain-containing protein [Acidimicrobiia bacterium]